MTKLDPDGQDSAVAQWMEDKLGVRFVDVRFLVKGHFNTEAHVDDEAVIDHVCNNRAGALGARYIVRPYNGRWQLYDRGKMKIRYYDTREAAEMVAIHNG